MIGLCILPLASMDCMLYVHVSVHTFLLSSTLLRKYVHNSLARLSTRISAQGGALVDSFLRLYHLVKNCILSSTNRRMHSCPGLHQSGWATIGVLIVDAAVRHSLWRESHFDDATHTQAFTSSGGSSSSSSSSSSASDDGNSHFRKTSEPPPLQKAIEDRSVAATAAAVAAAAAKELWDQKVDSSIQQALGNAAHMLRAGDIVSLKTFFR